MKKLTVLLLILPCMVLAGGTFTPTHAQPPSTADTPTFYHLVPGTYVNGWPRFTVHYPKDWVEVRPGPSEVFRAAAPGTGPRPSFSVNVDTGTETRHVPLEKFADLVLPFFRNIDKDATVVGDKPSRLRDGTPAREVEVHFVVNGMPFNWLSVATDQGDVRVIPGVGWGNGKIGEDLKAICYSLEFQPGKDKPVEVPPDVQEFIDKHRNDNLSHDLAEVLTNYSDRFLNSGMRKGEWERIMGGVIGSFKSFEIGITDFVPEGDRAYLAGFTVVNGLKGWLREIAIIKENGKWKFYGNQRDAPPVD